tara:strand:+ start:1889 stop:2092 length:204 start_codon:yes stop_codon:yes gene_type:complete
MTNEEKALQVRTLQRCETDDAPAWFYYAGILAVLEQKGLWNIEVIKNRAREFNLDEHLFGDDDCEDE